MLEWKKFRTLKQILKRKFNLCNASIDIWSLHMDTDIKVNGEELDNPKLHDMIYKLIARNQSTFMWETLEKKSQK